MINKYVEPLVMMVYYLHFEEAYLLNFSCSIRKEFCAMFCQEPEVLDLCDVRNIGKALKPSKLFYGYFQLRTIPYDKQVCGALSNDGLIPPF
jgi:hypothetical protein